MLICLALFTTNGFGGAYRVMAQVARAGETPRMLEILQRRVEQRPEDAGSWRMLGRWYHQQGDLPQAEEMLRRALTLDANHVAANFDLGVLWSERGDLEQAAISLTHVVALAPESEYGELARQRLQQLPPVSPSATVSPAGFRVGSLDGEATVGSVLPIEATLATPPDVPSRWIAILEAGSLYNSNVTLTPSSRDFFAAEAASAQGFISVDLEHRLVDRDTWRGGPTFAGYFNVNEGTFSDLDLQSYQPGAFVERIRWFEAHPVIPDGLLIPRFAYRYTLDQFSGRTFSERHALLASLTHEQPSGDRSVIHWSVDQTGFSPLVAAVPEERRDGWGHRIGAYRAWMATRGWLQWVGVGGELQWVDTEGRDFTFRGGNLHGDITIPLGERLDWISEGSVGYRDYYRSQRDPSRDETVWRAGTRLRWFPGDRWSLSTVFSYDRFESENELFEAQRILAGLITTYVF